MKTQNPIQIQTTPISIPIISCSVAGKIWTFGFAGILMVFSVFVIILDILRITTGQYGYGYDPKSAVLKWLPEEEQKLEALSRKLFKSRIGIQIASYFICCVSSIILITGVKERNVSRVKIGTLLQIIFLTFLLITFLIAAFGGGRYEGVDVAIDVIGITIGTASILIARAHMKELLSVNKV